MHGNLWRHLGAVMLMLLTPLAQAMPEIQHWQTRNGARVLFVEAHQLPVVDIRVVFAAGSAREPRGGGKAGLAQLVNTLLASGAGELSADQIAERFEDIGARYASEARRDMAVVSLRSLSDRELLEQAADTLSLVLGAPRFDAADFARERNLMRVAARAALQSPAELASRAFYKAVYGDHPYAAPPDGTEQSLTAIQRDDLLAFYRQYYVGRNATIAVMGDLDAARARQLVERVLGRLPAGKPAPALPPVEPLAGARTIRIDFPSSQTHVLIGQPGVARGDPDYFSLYVGNHVLGGGGFISRLTEEVREKRGLSYSVYSYFLPMQAPGPFIMGLQTRNAQTDEAVRVLRDTLRRYVAEGPAIGELEASKRNITGGFPLRIDSNRKIVEYLAMIGFYDLPRDYLRDFNRNVEAVTPATVRAALQKHLQPENMVTVLVGGE